MKTIICYSTSSRIYLIGKGENANDAFIEIRASYCCFFEFFVIENFWKLGAIFSSLFQLVFLQVVSLNVSKCPKMSLLS